MTTKTKERPILFNAAMVRAILGGRKTQTRRIVKPQPEKVLDEHAFEGGGCFVNRAKTSWGGEVDSPVYCPYGKGGDQLWVRETFSYAAPIGGVQQYVYKATDDIEMCDGKWKPSIHMPRLASRIDLLIKDVRVERVQDISEEDAAAEGISSWLDTRSSYERSRGSLGNRYNREHFKNLWESINGPESWAENPWVWVVEFARVKP